MLKSKWVKIAVALLVAFVLVLLITYQFLGAIVRTGVTRVGPTLTGCPIALQSLSLRLLRGELELTQLEVGNPAGYQTDRSFALGKVHITFDPGSVFGAAIHVREVTIEGPEITYELGLGGSNLGTILANVEAASGQAQGKPAAAAGAPGRKVLIDRVTVKDAKVRLASSLTGGLAAPIPLPDVELKDIGKEKQGAGLDEAIRGILTEVLTSVKGIASGAGGAIDAATGVGEAAKEGAAGALKGIKGLLRSDR